MAASWAKSSKALRTGGVSEILSIDFRPMGQHQSEHQKSVALSLSLRAGTAVHNTSRQSSVLCFSCCKTANFAHVPRLPPRPARAYFSQFAAVADRSFLRVTRNSVCQNGQTDSKAPIQRERERERERERRTAHYTLKSQTKEEGREGKEGRMLSFHCTVDGTLRRWVHSTCVVI